MPYSAADVRGRERILRMLLGGAPKAGKTVAAVVTAPRPVFVFNTDGQGALDPVAALGGEFTAADVKDTASYKREMLWFRAHSKEFRTVVFDNITMFSAFVEQELRKDESLKDGRQMWPAYDRAMMDVVHELLALPHHLVIIGHIEPGTNNVPGGFDHVLGVAGKAKTKISALIQDWVWLNVENAADGSGVKREFLLAPQGNWTKAVRSIQNTAKMPADVSLFIRLMNEPGAIAKRVAPKPAVVAVPPAKSGGVRVLPPPAKPAVKP